LNHGSEPNLTIPRVSTINGNSFGAFTDVAATMDNSEANNQELLFLTLKLREHECIAIL
jgi:hypothetical protein